MKKKILSIALLFMFSPLMSLAADNLPDEPVQNDSEIVTVEHEQQSNDQQVLPLKVEKKSALKFKSFKKFIKKVKTKIFAPQRILILMILGFLLLLPGAILAAVGVALIPAIILAVLGGTLMILGVLLG
jgi:hypothetical protein